MLEGFVCYVNMLVRKERALQSGAEDLNAEDLRCWSSGRCWHCAAPSRGLQASSCMLLCSPGAFLELRCDALPAGLPLGCAVLVRMLGCSFHPSLWSLMQQADSSAFQLCAPLLPCSSRHLRAGCIAGCPQPSPLPDAYTS